MFKTMLDESMVVHRSDPERLYNLRCSQLPYCPRSVIINYATRGMFFAMDMRMAYYVGVGHAVHEVMQSYLSLSGAFLADYKCRDCGTAYPLSHQFECCGFPTKYDEVLISYKGVVGHIDAIFKDKQDRYWIVDFKTTSLKSAPSKMRRPGDNYSRQVRAYAYLLWKQYGIKVEGVMLVFLPRDTPWQPSIWEYVMKPADWPAARDELIADRKRHKDTMSSKSLADFRKLFVTNCGNPYCEPCKTDVQKLLKTLAQRLDKFPIKKEQELAHGQR